MVRAKLPSELLSLRCDLAHDDFLRLFRGQTLHNSQADRSTSQHQHRAILCQGTLGCLCRVPSYTERLYQGADVQRHVIGKRQHCAGRNHNGVAQSAATARQANETPVIAGILNTVLAGAAGIAVDCGLDSDFLADAELALRHFGPDLLDDAGELVTESDGDSFLCYWMRFHRRKCRTAQILMQVSTAYADEGGCDLAKSVVVVRSN